MHKYTKLNLPTFEHKFRSNEYGIEIFDEFRKKYVRSTPEEWVRQNFLHYLTGTLNYPRSLIRVEFEVNYNRMKKRPDIVTLNNEGHPLLLVECKSSKVKITQSTIEQVTLYNTVLHAKYVVLTNGLTHYCCEQDFDSGKSQFLKEIPSYTS